MTTTVSALPSEVLALVQHVELNRSGWWDKAVQRLVLAAVWLSDHTPSGDEIQQTLLQEFRLSLSHEKVRSALKALEKQDLLVVLQGGQYRIPDSQRAAFEGEIEAAEKIASSARDFYCGLVQQLCDGLDGLAVWGVFESELLGPLIKEIGANAYHLIAGEPMIANRQLVSRFLQGFDVKWHPGLKDVVTGFLDPKNAEVRAYISRMLHARFCVEAGGLSEAVIESLRAAVGKQVRLRVFVDTNFLFSLLELHQNPSNAAARDLQHLVTQLQSNPKVQLFVMPRTIEEAKSSIASAKFRLSGIPVGKNFTQAALQLGVSGMAERFLAERLRRDGRMTAEDWFDPYLNDFITIARGKGVELFNENLDSYSMRQDVVDDILLVQTHEEKLDETRRKSYQKIEHDMVLWHFVNDNRPSYLESPIDAQDWILTVDFRLLGFDEHKQKQAGSRVPLCLHPTSLIQLLQFWVPRTEEFEEAVLGSIRLPFLFQEFDVEAERTSLRILKCLGRFEGRDDIPAQTITNVVLNDGLRSRLMTERSEEGEEEIALIREALIGEMAARADAASNEAKRLQNTLNEREAALSTLDALKRKEAGEVARLKATATEESARLKTADERLAAQGAEISDLKAKWQGIEEMKQRRYALLRYFCLLCAVILIAGGAAWQTDRIFPDVVKTIGLMPSSTLVAVFAFVVGHLLLELGAQRHPRMTQLWPFKQMSRFRSWLWGLVLLGVVLGVGGNLYANWIQKNLDQEQQGAYFSPSWTAFQADRGRHFSVIVDGVSN